MPKNDVFSMHVQIGNKFITEHTIGDSLYVGWDINIPETFTETLTDDAGAAQGYPLTPYQVVIETFDKNLTLWFRVYIDGQQVASRPVFGETKMVFSGIYDNGYIREFHFSIPVITENKCNHLPADRQSSIGKIEAIAFNCIANPGQFKLVDMARPKNSISYHSATKNDNHSGVCTTLRSGICRTNVGSSRFKKRQCLTIGQELSKLILRYCPIHELNNQLSIQNIQVPFATPPTSHSDIHNSANLLSRVDAKSEISSPAFNKADIKKIHVKLNMSAFSDQPESKMDVAMEPSASMILMKDEQCTEQAGDNLPMIQNDSKDYQEIKGFIALTGKNEVSASSQTVLSPQKSISRRKFTGPKPDIIVIDDDDDDFTPINSDQDSVIWYGDDSCFFVDEEPQDITIVDLSDESFSSTH